MKIYAAIIVFIAVLATSGCSIIAGKDDMVSQKGLTFMFVETLRNGESLRGESLNAVSYNTDRATTLQRPNGVFADAFRVYVIDTAPARIFVFDRGDRKATILDGSLLGTPPLPKDDVKLIAPAGIAVDWIGTLWVSDSQQGRVFGYMQNGKMLYNIGKFGELAMPMGLAVNNSGNRLYVADAHDHKIKVFALDGTRLFDIGATGKSDNGFKFPKSIAFDRDGNIYILDTQSRVVQVFDLYGKIIKTVDLSGAAGSVKPNGIAVDSDGHLYVTDEVNNNVLIFDRSGEFLFAWDGTGSPQGRFWTPEGIFIDNRDTIYIADKTNGRIQVYQYIR